jgi:hypothetical protein
MFTLGKRRSCRFHGLFASAAVLLAAGAFARTYVGTDGAWANDDNWSPTGVPQAGDTAEFNANATITGNFSIPGSVDIRVASGKTVTISGDISGSGSLINSGLGTLKLSGENSFAGDFIHSNGICYAMSPKALGSDNSGTVYVYIPAQDSAHGFYFVGVDTQRDIGMRLAKDWTGGQITGPMIYFGDGSTVCTNYFRGLLYKNGNYGYLRLRSMNKGTTYFLGGGEFRSSLFFLSRDTGSTTIVDETPIAFNHASGHPSGEGWLVLKCTDNYFFGGSSDFASSNYGNLRTDVDYAFAPTSHVCQTKFMFDLNGTTQKIEYLFGTGNDSSSKLHSDDSALLTLTGTKFHTNICAVTGQASLTYEGASDKTVLMTGKSTSSGTLTIDGARKVEFAAGAQWSGRIDLKSGATLLMPDAAAYNGELDISVAEDAVITNDFSGVVTVSSFKLGDSALLPGYYAAEAAEGVTKLDVLKGPAQICVKVEAGAASTATWDGGGTDSKMSTPENWDGDATPDLTGGGLTALFPASGVHPLVDGTYFITSLEFTGEALSGTSSFEAAPGASLMTADGGGITIPAGASSSAKHNVYMGAPVVAVGSNCWNVGQNSILYLTNTLSSFGSAKVLKTGVGELHITTPPHMAGQLVLGGGNTYIDCSDAFSDPLVEFWPHVRREHPVESTSRIYFTKDCTVVGPTHLYNDPDIRGSFVIAQKDTTLVYDNLVTIESGYLRHGAEKGAKVYFRGGIGAKYGNCHTIFAGDGEFIIEDRPVGLDGTAPTVYWDSSTSTVTLNVASNKFGTAGSTMRVHNHVRTAVDYAFHPDTSMRLHIPTTSLDLMNTKQKFKLFAVWNEVSNATTGATRNPTYKCTVKGEEGSSLTETDSGIYTNALYEGGASYCYTGTGTRRFTWPSSTSGACSLAGSGTLEFLAPGAWPGGAWTGRTSRVVLEPTATGVIRFRNAAALARFTDVEVSATDGSAGTIDIPENIELTASFLRVNGKKQRLGRYGSSTSGAENKLGCFTGAGRINFIGDGVGTCVIFK